MRLPSRFYTGRDCLAGAISQVIQYVLLDRNKMMKGIKEEPIQRWVSMRKTNVLSWKGESQELVLQYKEEECWQKVVHQHRVISFFLKLLALVSSIFIAKALKSDVVKAEKVHVCVYIMVVFIFSHGEHDKENTLWKDLCQALLTEAAAEKPNKLNMQILAFMNQPSLLFVSVGEIQYGRQRKSMQLPHFKYFELLKVRPAGSSAFTHFCYSPFLPLLTVS